VTHREIILGLELSPDCAPLGASGLAALMFIEEVGDCRFGISLQRVGNLLRDMYRLGFVDRSYAVQEEPRGPGHPPVTWYLSSGTDLQNAAFRDIRCMYRGRDRRRLLDAGETSIEEILAEAEEVRARRVSDAALDERIAQEGVEGDGGDLENPSMDKLWALDAAARRLLEKRAAQTIDFPASRRPSRAYIAETTGIGRELERQVARSQARARAMLERAALRRLGKERGG
jgi:hypothetical protein